MTALSGRSRLLMAPSHWLLSSFWIHQVMGPLIVKGANADLLLLIACFTTPMIAPTNDIPLLVSLSLVE